MRPGRSVGAALGVAVAGAGAAVVAFALARDWDEARRAVSGAGPGWLVAALVLAAAGMVGLAWPWRRAMAVLGAAVGRSTTVAWYFVGELGKYLPGGVWPVIGRGERARRSGMAGPVAYGGVALSLAAAYLGAVAVAVALLPAGAGAGVPAAGVVLLPLGLALLHPRVVGFALRLVERLARRPLAVDPPPWGVTAGLVAGYVPAWLLIGSATWCVARALDAGASPGRVALAAVTSWIVGFLAVPVPGGVGVREAVFIGTAGLPLGTGAATAVVSRLLFMLVDAGGAVVGGTFLRRHKRVAVPAAGGVEGT